MHRIITYKIARAAGLDAGNRSMRAGYRTKWSIDDFNAAARETNRLIDIIETNPNRRIYPISQLRRDPIKYRVFVQASKQGSIGSKYHIKRTYEVEAETPGEAQDKARELAYAEGLEHMLTHIVPGT